MQFKQQIYMRMSRFALITAATIGASVQAANWVSVLPKVRPIQATASAVSSEMASGSSIHIGVSLKLRNKAELDALTRDVIARKSRFLTPGEFAARFAPSASQQDAVVAHLRAAGFINIQVASNHLLVTADGTAGAVQAAFKTRLHTITQDGHIAFTNSSTAMVPAPLADIVLAVHGLQSAPKVQPAAAFAAKSAPLTAGSTAHYPAEFTALYNATTLPAASSTTVGIIAAGNIDSTLAELNNYAGVAGYPAPVHQEIYTGTMNTGAVGGFVPMGVTQNVLAAAGGQLKQMLFYVAPSGSDADLVTALNRAVSDNLAHVFVMYDIRCEADEQANGTMATEDQLFQQAVTQGQTFVVPSGENYGMGCAADDRTYPATSPYVIAVGGTTLQTDGSSYVSESAWNGTNVGLSPYEDAPSWQVQFAPAGKKPLRIVPDLAFDADFASGSYTYSGGRYKIISGSVLSASLFTGFWARVQHAHNNQLPFPAAMIYSLGVNHPSAFHDITTGSNGQYSATPGWDHVSGWGSLNVAEFNAAIGAVPAPTPTGLPTPTPTGLPTPLPTPTPIPLPTPTPTPLPTPTPTPLPTPTPTPLPTPTPTPSPTAKFHVWDYYYNGDIVTEHKHMYRFNVQTNGAQDGRYAVLGFWCEPGQCTAEMPDWETDTTKAYWQLLR